jgi:transposase
MANRLKMALIDTILTLHQRQWSIRRIADELGIDRGTVARYLRRAATRANAAAAPIDRQSANAASAVLGAGEAPIASNAASAPSGSGAVASGPGCVSHEANPASVPATADEAPITSKAATQDEAPIASNAATAPEAPIGAKAATQDEAPMGANVGGGGEASIMPEAAGLEAGDVPSAEAETPGRSICEPWRALIAAKLELDLSAQRIHQDLVEHGFGGSYYSVRRFVRNLERKQPLPFRRLECGPGEEAQVDFGAGAPVRQPGGRQRRPHVFRIVLSHSRKAYSEAVWRQTTEDFIRCLENAFRYFGGCPQRLVIDNLRAAVTKADWYEPELHPKLEAFCRHYGTVILPTRPYRPRHKGKVERGIGYVKGNGLKGRVFDSLDEENRFLLDWEQTVADTRVHGTTRRRVDVLFAEVERAALQPLPLERFPFFHEAQRVVHRDGHIEVARAYYTVPPEYLGRRVWARWDSRVVRVFNTNLEQIAVHAQREPGQFSTQSAHIVAEKISAVERGAAWLLGRVRRIGRHSAGWAEALIEKRGVEGVRVLQGLLHLAEKHPWEALEQACEVAHSYGAYRLRTVRDLINRQAAKQTQFDFMDKHPIIRDLSEYDQFVKRAFRKESM